MLKFGKMAVRLDRSLKRVNEKGNPEFIFIGGHDTVINADILTNAMYDA